MGSLPRGCRGSLYPLPKVKRFGWCRFSLFLWCGITLCGVCLKLLDHGILKLVQGEIYCSRLLIRNCMSQLECSDFPEQAGRYELEECTKAPYTGEDMIESVSYVTEDDGDLFYMDVVNLDSQVQGYHEEYSLDCMVRTGNSGGEECSFGSASYEHFSPDEITREVELVARSVDEGMLDEFREDARR